MQRTNARRSDYLEADLIDMDPWVLGERLGEFRTSLPADPRSIAKVGTYRTASRLYGDDPD